MPLDKYSNFAYSTVAIIPANNSNGATLTVATGQGTRFPSAPFNVVVWPASSLAAPENAEILRVTNKSGDIFTINRQQENTSLRTIQAGDNISASITAKAFSDIQPSIIALALALS